MEEKQLIKQCKRGDKKAFELLVHQYSPMLFALTKRYTNNSAEAKDALQEALILIFRNIGAYESTGNFSSWMKRIAITSGLKEIRRNRNHHLTAEVLDYNEKSDGYETPVALENLNIADVQQSIKRLSPPYRVAFNLYIIEGYKYEEIAEILDIEVSTCRMRVSRARKQLHELISKNQNYGLEAARRVD